MEITVDTSVLIAVIAGEPERDAMITLTQGAYLIAPHSVHWEIGNALSAMLKKGRTSLNQVTRAIEVYYSIPVRYVDVEIEEALSIASALNIYAYDAYLIRCAERYNAPLLTLDQSLERVAVARGVETVEVQR